MSAFGVGSFGAIHEILGSGDRPYVLAFCGLLMTGASATYFLERFRK